MKKSLLIVLSLSCFISFSFAGYRTDKYQAIKEGGEYYNQLQQIYQNEDYISRHNMVTNNCLSKLRQAEAAEKRSKQICNSRPWECRNDGSLLDAGTISVDFDGGILFFNSVADGELWCNDPVRGMNDEEKRIYGYIYDTITIEERAMKDNQCYQSMKGYYDEKEDGCLCEDGNHLESNICVKDEVVEEVKAEEINKNEAEELESQQKLQEELTEKFNNALNYGKGKNYEKAIELLKEIVGNKGTVEWDNYEKAEKALKIFEDAVNKANEENKNTDIPELNQAILRMYEKGLTIFNEPVSFMASNGLRRDEAAKFFVQYAKEVMGKTPDYSKKGCTFNDLNQAWSDLKDVIVESCQLGLFQGHNGKFMPTQQLTNAQAITVFMRLLEGYKDESGTHFANNYYESAHAQGFLHDTPLDNKAYFDNYTTRGNVAKMLFRGQKSN